MQTQVDREAGFATFRQGRALCLRLHGRLDLGMAEAVERQLRADAVAVRLRLECSALHAAACSGARLLAAALVAWSQSRDHRSIEILNLHPLLLRRPAWRPLREFSDGDRTRPPRPTLARAPEASHTSGG